MRNEFMSAYDLALECEASTCCQNCSRLSTSAFLSVSTALFFIHDLTCRFQLWTTAWPGTGMLETICQRFDSLIGMRSSIMPEECCMPGSCASLTHDSSTKSWSTTRKRLTTL